MTNFISTSVDTTKELGYKFASKLKKGDVLVLNGDLGSGKTIFVSGFLSFYGKGNEASSPTFTIVNEHNLTKDLNLYHFDVYRLETSDEFLAIGGDEYFSQGITLMEWGEKIKDLLPKEYLEVNIFKDTSNLDFRNFVFIPRGKRYENLVKEVLE